MYEINVAVVGQLFAISTIALLLVDIHITCLVAAVGQLSHVARAILGIGAVSVPTDRVTRKHVSSSAGTTLTSSPSYPPLHVETQRELVQRPSPIRSDIRRSSAGGKAQPAGAVE